MGLLPLLQGKHLDLMDSQEKADLPVFQPQEEPHTLNPQISPRPKVSLQGKKKKNWKKVGWDRGSGNPQRTQLTDYDEWTIYLPKIPALVPQQHQS